MDHAPNLAALISQVQHRIKEETKHEEEEARKRITEADIRSAWEVISPAGHDSMSKAQLLDHLKLFYPDLKPADIKELVGHGQMTPERLIDLLINHELPPEFDPLEEAFHILDPGHTGYVNPTVLKHILSHMKDVIRLDQEDMNLLMMLVDSDQDGKVSLMDFKQVGRWALREENHRSVVTRTTQPGHGSGHASQRTTQPGAHRTTQPGAS